MNDSCPPTDDDSEAILARFVQELEKAADPESVIAKYQADHRHLADELREIADMMKKVDCSSPNPAPDLPPCLGGFRLQRRIAQGGMGEVFEALEERLQRRVAVKIVHRERLSPVHRIRFLREQLVLARLHQTHIVPIFAAGEAGPVQYFAMPYIEGAALHHALDVARQPRTNWPSGEMPNLSTLAEMYTTTSGERGEGGECGESEVATAPYLVAPPVPAQDAAPAVAPRLSRSYFRSVASVMADVADALQHAHGAGIFHRDVKPSNIMIGPDGSSWVIDFGLARYPKQPGPSVPLELPELTAAEQAVSGVMGTPRYMAPEQWTDPETVDARADVWGLGATLYELLTLQPAFKGSSEAEVKTEVVTTSPPPPRRLVRGLSADLEAICMKALQRQPEQRYATAHQFAEDLRLWLRDEPPSIVRGRRWRQLGSWVRHNKGWAAALGLLLVTGLVILLGWGATAQLESNAARREAGALNRSILLLDMQQSRLSDRKVGWSREVLKRADDAARIRIDDDLRNQTIAALAGLDASRIKQWRHGGSAVAWDRAGERLLLGGEETGQAGLWEWQRGKEVQFEHAGEGPVAFLDDGTPVQLVADPDDRWSAVLWDLSEDRPIQQFQIPPGGRAQPAGPLNPVVLAMTENGAFVAAATTEVDEQENVGKGHLAVWESRTGKMLVQAEAKATALSLSPDGTVLAAGDADGWIRFWSLPDGKELATLRSGRTAIDCLALGRNPHRAEAAHAAEPTTVWLLATGEMGGTLSVWDLRTRTLKSRCLGVAWSVLTVAFSPDGMTLASAGHGGTGGLWDVASGQLLLKGWGLDWARSVAFSPDGRRLAVCSSQPDPKNSRIEVYELEPGRGMQLLRGLIGPIAQVRFSPDCRWVAALSHNWQVAVWDIRADRLVHVLDVRPGVFADNANLCFSPDGRRFAFVSGRQATLWEVESGHELASWDLPPGLTDRLAFHSADELVLFRMETADGKPPFGEFPWREHPRVCRIRHLSVEGQMKTIAEIEEFRKYVFTTVVSPDGNYIAVDGLGGPNGDRPSVRIYSGTSGEELATLPQSNRAANVGGYLSLDATGKLLAYRPSDDPQVTLVDLANQEFKGVIPFPSQNLGPEASYWIQSLPTPGMTLMRRRDNRPLFTAGIDGEMTGFGSFSIDGKYWGWCRKDGSVIVCDLPAVQRHLAAMGLGW